MTAAELAPILELHRKWRRGEPGGARANLTGANLTGADLTGADLAGADLARANLTDADLADARNIPEGTPSADPATPYSRDTSPDLAARAKRYRDRHPEIPVVEHLDRKILDAITVGGGKLDMGRWHSCETTHCRAGWAITLAGEQGATLETRVGPHLAGAMIYRAST